LKQNQYPELEKTPGLRASVPEVCLFNYSAVSDFPEVAITNPMNIRIAKASPGKLNYASSGPGTPPNQFDCTEKSPPDGCRQKESAPKAGDAAINEPMWMQKANLKGSRGFIWVHFPFTPLTASCPL
jgi:hypothetical protein